MLQLHLDEQLLEDQGPYFYTLFQFEYKIPSSNLNEWYFM